jgi:ankyrin repeat protein
MAGKNRDQLSHSGSDNAGRSELHHAVVDRNLERVKELVRQGMSVNLADRDGWTPLHFAAQNNDVDIARFLLDSGASVDPRDSNGNTPLFTAIFSSRGRGELIELLRQRGADATSKNKFGVSPLNLAQTIANYDVARFFADVGEG